MPPSELMHWGDAKALGSAIFPEVKQGQGDSTALSGSSHVGQGLLEELTWENLPAFQES